MVALPYSHIFTIDCYKQLLNIIELALIFEETLLAFAQGVTQQALSRYEPLRSQLSEYTGSVVRLTLHSPYMSFYIVIHGDTIELIKEYEGSIQGRIDCDSQWFFWYLLSATPDKLTKEIRGVHYAVEDDANPELYSFIKQVISAWDFWMLIRTLIKEIIPEGLDFLTFLSSLHHDDPELRQTLHRLETMHLELIPKLEAYHHQHFMDQQQLILLSRHMRLLQASLVFMFCITNGLLVYQLLW